ncbi:MAG: hypothetical protein U1F98_10560 [Verrucomicrobiota bacterium]
MKFLGAVLAHALIAFVLVWGILLAVGGNYWLLATGAAVYLLILIKAGCLPPTQAH